MQLLKKQLNKPLNNDVNYFFVLTGAHDYLKKLLAHHDWLETTCFKLKKAFQSIKKMELALAQITAERMSGAALVTKSVISWNKYFWSKKNGSQKDESSKSAIVPLVTLTISNNIANCKCFNCNKIEHRFKNCPASKKASTHGLEKALDQ